jgi:hypothetical protein
LAAVAARIGALYAKEVAKVVKDLSPSEAALVAVTLRYTDASLERGGLYDINSDWIPPHSYHRFGRDLDIAKRGKNAAGDEFVGGQEVRVNVESILRALMTALDTSEVNVPPEFPLGGGVYDEDSLHYHIRVLGGETLP